VSSSGNRILGSVATTDGDTAVDASVGLPIAVCVSATVARVRTVDVEPPPSLPLDEVDEVDDLRPVEYSEDPDELASDSMFTTTPGSENENRFRPGGVMVV